MSRENIKSCCTACGTDWVDHAGIQPTCERLQHALTACRERDKHIIALCQKSGDQQKRIAELEAERDEFRLARHRDTAQILERDIRIAELKGALRHIIDADETWSDECAGREELPSLMVKMAREALKGGAK